MTYPASDVVTTNTDASTDSPASARADILDLMQKFNQLRAHITSFWQTTLNRTSAALVRSDLGSTAVGDAVFVAATTAAGRSALGAAASGANADITSLQSTCTADGTNVIGYRYIPQNAQSSAYTFAQADGGKHIYSTNAGAQTVTLPTNASVAIAVGTAVVVCNNGTTAITFTTTGCTVYKAGTSAAWASGGTLGVRGECTWLKVATDTWFVSGAGLS
jgi:hypothetical protein